MMNSIPLQCEICYKRFSGPDPAKQHFQSASHWKKKENKQLSQTVYGNWCKVCLLKCDTQEQLSSHMQSPRHLHEVEKSQLFIGSDQTSTTGGARNLYSDSVPQSTQHEATSRQFLQSPQGEDRREYIFNGQTGFCHICNIELTSRAHAEQHLQGKNHQKKCTSNMITSLGGLTIRDDQQPYIKSEVSIIPGENGFNPVRNEPVQLPYNNYDPNLIIQMQPKQIEKPDYFFDAGKGFCNVCNIHLTSKAHAEQHIQGKNHQKKKSTGISSTSQWNPGYNNHTMFSPVASYTSDCHNEAVQQPFVKHEPVYGEIEPSVKKEPIVMPQDSCRPGTPLYIKPDTVIAKKDSVVYREASMPSLESSDLCSKHLVCKDGEMMLSVHKPAKTFEQEEKEQHIPYQSPNQPMISPYNPACDAITAALNSTYWDNNAHTQPQVPQLKPSITPNSEYTFDGSTGYCHLCSIVLTSKQHASQHLSGSKHAKARQRQSEAPLVSPLPQQNRETEFGHPGQEYSFDGTQGFCKICSVMLTSVAMLRQHISGSSHRREKERWLSQSRGNQYPLHCETCKKSFSGPESAEQHFVSDKHKKKLALAVPLGRFDLSDNTQWYHCDSCNCQLNSREQLEIHKKSFKHKAAEEREASLLFQQGTNDHTFDLQDNVSRGMEPGVTKPPFTQLAMETGRESQPILQKPFKNTITSGIDDLSSLGKFAALELLEMDTQNVHNAIHPADQPTISKTGKTEVQHMQSEVELSQLKFEPDTNIFGSCPDLHLSRTALSIDSNSSQTLSNYVTAEELPVTRPARVEVNTSQPIPIQARFACVSERALDPRELCLHDSPLNLAGIGRGRPLTGAALHGRSSSSLDGDRPSIPDNSITKLKTVSDSSGANFSENIKNDTSAVGYGQESCQHYHGGLSAEIGDEARPFKHFKHYCWPCNRPMNTQKSYDEHIRGKHHKQKVLKEIAPNRQHGPMVKMKQETVAGRTPSQDLTYTHPRQYQSELYEKAMKGDKLIFLPTGTGKTLVSAMVIRMMLELNPTRQVLFLVDRVLLVLQQSQYLKKQLGNQQMRRFDQNDGSSGDLDNRHLLFATLCGGRQNTGGIPLWKHDIIIVTAAFCSNLLSQEILKWEDMCLVVIDEAHHCQKNHPYNNLLRRYHHPCPEKPKLLGLTASPAGRDTIDKTLEMLRDLLENLDKAQIEYVEENKPELESFQSNAKCSIKSIPSSEEDSELKTILQRYLVFCYARFSTYTNIDEFCNIAVKSLNNGHISEQEVSRCAPLLFGEMYDLFRISMDFIKVSENANFSAQEIDYLKAHTKNICVAYNCLVEMGVDNALEVLSENFDETSPSNPVTLPQKFRLPFEEVYNFKTAYNKLKKGLKPAQLNNLISLLLENNESDDKGNNPLCLILVEERKTAFLLSETLKSNEIIKYHNWNVACIVGHGNGGETGGMRVNQQKRVLEEIRNYNHQIIVATSVAEEGIDLPECELVVTMYAPDTVRAFVQMRGRARKKNSKFIIMCTDPGEEESLSDLCNKEKNMIAAVTHLLEEVAQVHRATQSPSQE
ncbi:hypothetical protein ScPMuIL_016406 [Solemya velum]